MLNLLFGTKPNIERLESKRDIKGLIDALGYGERKYKNYKYGKSNFENEAMEVSQISLGAASALAHYADPRAINPMIHMFIKRPYSIGDWVDTHNPWNFASVTISKFGQAAIDPLIDVRKIGHPGDREWSIYALGHIGDKRAIAYLIGNCIPEATIWALGNIGGGKEVIDFLVQFLTDVSKSSSEVDLVVHAFGSGKFGQEAGDTLSNILNEILCDEKSKMYHRVCKVAMSLCELGDPRGMEAVLKFWSIPQYEKLRDSSSLFTLGKFDNSEVIKLLHSKLSNYDGGLRVARHRDHEHPIDAKVFYAALGLARLGEASSIPPLVDVLSNPELRTVYAMRFDSYHTAALKSIVNFGEMAVKPLTELSQSADGKIKAVAEGILLSLRDRPKNAEKIYFRYS